MMPQNSVGLRGCVCICFLLHNRVVYVFVKRADSSIDFPWLPSRYKLWLANDNGVRVSHIIRYMQT